MDPFSPEGAKRIAQLAGQPLASGAGTTPAGAPTLPQSQPAAPDPFSAEGAARLSQLTGQALASPINVSTLGTPSPISIPSLPSYPSRSIQNIAITNTPRQDALQNEREGLVADITSANERLGTQTARRRELEAQQNIPGLNQQLLELNNQIRQLQADAFAATQRSEDRLAPTFAIQGEQAQIERQRSVRAFGLAAAAEAIQGNIALAEDYVRNALEEEFGPLEQEIENKKFLLDINRENFSTEEQRRAEKRQEELDQDKEALADERTNRENILSVMLAAAQNGADNVTLNAIQNTRTPQEAISAAGQFLQGENTSIIEADGRKKLVDMRSGRVIADLGLGSTSSGAGIAIGGNGSGPSIISDIDNMIAIMRESVGGRDLTQGEAEPLKKAFTSLDQLGELAATIEGQNTGPIVGILRSNNPFDVQARLISAQLKAMIPGLARGIYGEVGVLTDTDIANYQQTLPNLKSTEDVSRAVLGMTLRVIQRSIQRQIQVMAASGRDVSGFEGLYQQLEANAALIEETLGAGSGARAGASGGADIGDLDFVF